MRTEWKSFAAIAGLEMLKQPCKVPVDNGYENKPETEGVGPDMQEGEPCRKCSTPVIKRKPHTKPKGDYYFE